MRDNDTSPPPTENPAAPLIQADPPLLTPNKGEFDTGDPAWPSPPPSTGGSQYVTLHPELAEPNLEPSRSKPLFRGFERPSFSRIVILTVLCLITYPAFYVLTLVAKDRSLFIVRVIVSVWCSGVGFALGYTLLATGARYLEAASEFTLVLYWDFLEPYFKQPGPP